MCSPKILLLVFLFAFIFFTAAHFHLAGRFSFSSCHYEIFKFSSDEICPLHFFITCSSSFSVIHMSVDIKN